MKQLIIIEKYSGAERNQRFQIQYVLYAKGATCRKKLQNPFCAAVRLSLTTQKFTGKAFDEEGRPFQNEK